MATRVIYPVLCFADATETSKAGCLAGQNPCPGAPFVCASQQYQGHKKVKRQRAGGPVPQRVGQADTKHRSPSGEQPRGRLRPVPGRCGASH